MSGSFKTLIKTLESTFIDDELEISSESLSLPEPLQSTINTYVQAHDDYVASENSRLNEELISIFQKSIPVNPNLGININPKDNSNGGSNATKELFFIECLIGLYPCYISPSGISFWVDRYKTLTLNSAGILNALITASIKFLNMILLDPNVYNNQELTDLIYDIAKETGNDIFSVFVRKINLLGNVEDSTVYEERQRFIKMNARTLLTDFGSKRSKLFFEIANDFFIDIETRIETLVLLSTVVSQQSIHFHEISNTPLLDNLFNCLLQDISASAISVCCSVLVMILPHVCNKLAPYLPKLFTVYARLVCWQTEEDGSESDGANDSDLSDDKYKRRDSKPKDDNDNDDDNIITKKWKVLNHKFNAEERIPTEYDKLFTFIYGLYPMNFMEFLRDPIPQIEKIDSKHIDNYDEYTIRAQSKPLLQTHLMHPNLLFMTSVEEREDQTRWESMGSPQDIAAFCSELNNGETFNSTVHIADVFSPPLNSIDQEQSPSIYNINSVNNSILHSPLQRARNDMISSPSRLPKLNNSPSMKDINIMLETHKHLYSKTETSSPRFKKVFQSPINKPMSLSDALEDNTTEQNSLVVPQPPITLSNATSFQSFNERSTELSTPILRAQPSIQETGIAFYQRELLLMRNELDFTNYVKELYKVNFRKLKEKRIHDAREVQSIHSLLISNRTLKAKMAKVDVEYTRLKDEYLLYKKERLKYETQLLSRNKDSKVMYEKLKRLQEETDSIVEFKKIENEKILTELLKRESEINILENQLQYANEVIGRLNSTTAKLSQLPTARKSSQLVDDDDEEDENDDEDHGVHVTEEGNDSDTFVCLSDREAEYESLRFEKNILLEENQQIIDSFNKEREELLNKIDFYENELNSSMPSMRSNLKRYVQLREDKILELTGHVEFLQSVIEQKDKSLRDMIGVPSATRPNLPHSKSLLGYDIERSIPRTNSGTPSIGSGFEGNRLHLGKSKSRTPEPLVTAAGKPFFRSASEQTLGKTAETETLKRIRGRGGIQNVRKGKFKDGKGKNYLLM